jgi:TonB-dependent SusC/RagA subfamily outer membrane receptor
VADISNTNDYKILELTIKTKKAQFLIIKLKPKLSTNINTSKMKKYTLLSVVLILGLNISSLAQTKKVLTQDKDKNATTINTSIVDSQSISRSIQIRPYKFNPTNLNGYPPTIVIDGKISEQGFTGIEPNDIQSISVVKGEKATSLYGDKNGAGVILITTKKRAKEPKVEK